MTQELPLPLASKPITDMMGRKLLVPVKPNRIISLVPSQTELLMDLGLADQVIGITKFCIHPRNQAIPKAKIGGTKNFNFDLITRLNPDLIIGNKEENYQAGINLLARDYPVWMSDVADLESALEMILAIGELTGKATKATEITAKIQQEFSTLEPTANKSAAYFIWRNPYMAAGKNTFIQAMLTRMGLKNVFAGKESRYPEITPTELKKASPDVLLLSSEPYPFTSQHISEVAEILPNAKIILADGELFSWYGSRLVKTPSYLKQVQQKLL